MQLADFLGDWHFDREIDDKTLLGIGIVQGQARFSPTGDVVAYDETSEMTFAASPPFKGTRRYLWKADSEGVAVMFADGRDFHRLDLSAGTTSAAHWCDPDQYDVIYDFSDWPRWSSRWKVRGPRKDYVMETRYRRLTETM